MIWRLAPLIAASIGLLLLFRIWVPNFLAPANMLDLTQQISVNAIIAFGMTFVILIQGIDLSVGAVLALVGTCSVFTLTAVPQLGPAGAAGAGLSVAAGFGIFHGVTAGVTKIPPFIITLATMWVARGFALRFNEGRPMAIPDGQEWFLFIGNGRVLNWLPVPVVIMLLVFVLMTILLHTTYVGRHLFGMGSNLQVARLSGVPTVRHTIMVYTLCSLLAGIAGIIHTSQLYSAEPNSGLGFELNAIAAVVVGGASFSGGIGSIPGTLAGAIIIGILDKGLNQAGVHYSMQYVVKGLVILGAVYIDVLRKK